MLAPTAIKRLTVANEPARAAVCSGVRPFLLNTNSTQYIVWYNFVKKMNICTYLCEDNPNVVAQNESNFLPYLTVFQEVGSFSRIQLSMSRSPVLAAMWKTPHPSRDYKTLLHSVRPLPYWFFPPLLVCHHMQHSIIRISVFLEDFIVKERTFKIH